MNEDQIKGALRSRTVVMALTAFIAYVLRRFGLPAVPPEIHGELVALAQQSLDAIIPMAIAGAAYYRVVARDKIKGWLR